MSPPITTPRLRRPARRARAVVQFFVVLLAAAGVSVVHTEPAAAACTYSNHPNLDPGSSQVVNPVAGFSGIAMRDGPWQYCDVKYRVPWYGWVDLYCWTNGQDVNGQSTWSYVRYNDGASGDRVGWINDYYLSGNGSSRYCSP
jgi:hypothetical protein